MEMKQLKNGGDWSKNILDSNKYRLSLSKHGLIEIIQSLKVREQFCKFVVEFYILHKIQLCIVKQRGVDISCYIQQLRLKADKLYLRSMGQLYKEKRSTLTIIYKRRLYLQKLLLRF